ILFISLLPCAIWLLHRAWLRDCMLSLKTGTWWGFGEYKSCLLSSVDFYFLYFPLNFIKLTYFGYLCFFLQDTCSSPLTIIQIPLKFWSFGTSTRSFFYVL